jgi:hypothetical protein
MEKGKLITHISELRLGKFYVNVGMPSCIVKILDIGGDNNPNLNDGGMGPSHFHADGASIGVGITLPLQEVADNHPSAVRLNRCIDEDRLVTKEEMREKHVLPPTWVVEEASEAEFTAIVKYVKSLGYKYFNNCSIGTSYKSFKASHNVLRSSVIDKEKECCLDNNTQSIKNKLTFSDFNIPHSFLIEEDSEVDLRTKLEDEARRRYPIGSKYYCPHLSKVITVVSTSFKSGGSTGNTCVRSSEGFGCVYDEKKWSELVLDEEVEKSVFNTEDFKIEIDEEVTEEPVISKPLIQSTYGKIEIEVISL